VDFPEPLSPTRPTISFGYTSRLTPSTACTTRFASSRKCLVTPFASTSGFTRFLRGTVPLHPVESQSGVASKANSDQARHGIAEDRCFHRAASRKGNVRSKNILLADRTDPAACLRSAAVLVSRRDRCA